MKMGNKSLSKKVQIFLNGVKIKICKDKLEASVYLIKKGFSKFPLKTVETCNTINCYVENNNKNKSYVKVSACNKMEWQ